jgi:hypothetical protein
VNSGLTVFSQLIQHLPEKEFPKCVARHNGDSNFRGFSCWDQLLAMAFAQLTYRESLRDIESCLRALQSKLYHMGIRGKVSRSTLADANESHDWRIFAEFAQVLIGIARPLQAHDSIGVDLDQSLYALDSTAIDLCLSIFPWAKFRRRKAAGKMHTLLVPPVEHLFSTLFACGRAGSIDVDFFVSAPDADVLDSAHFFSPNCRVAPARCVVGGGDQKQVRRLLLE